MAVKTGIGAAIYVASLPSVAFTDVAANPDADYKIYTISDAAKRYWDKAVAVVVERSTDSGVTWTTVPASEYTVQHVGGKIIFAVAQAVGTLIRVDGAYLPISQLGEAKEWTLDADAKIIDATKFGDTWEVKVVGQRSATVKLGRWWMDGFFLSQITNPLVVVLYIDATAGTRYEGYARLKADSVKTAANALVEEDLNLEVDGELIYVAA